MFVLYFSRALQVGDNITAGTHHCDYNNHIMFLDNLMLTVVRLIL